MNRLHKLLTVEGFQGIKNIILESPCFQLDHNGQVVRHVFVGMTESELLIATQEVCDLTNLNPNTDLELDGLCLHSSVPLERVRFYVVDDRSRKFAICSCVGEVKYFEQCNTPDGSDALWADWVEFIRKQDDPRSFGYKIWNILENVYSDKHHFEFIKRPFPFYGVESVASQTIEIRTSRQKEHPLICYKNIKACLASVKTKYGIEEMSTVNDKLMESSSKQTQPTKSNSCSTIREGCRLSQNVRKFGLFSLVYQFCHGDKDRTIYEFFEYYPNSNLSVEILRIYAQILKYQFRDCQSLESGTSHEGSVESEPSITDVIAGFKAEEKSGPAVTDETLHMSPRSWSLLRSKLLKTKIEGLPTLSQVVNDVLFEKCDSKSKPSSITNFSPFEVSKEIMLMTSELIVKITHMDVTALQMKKIPSSISVLLEHFRLVSEIIKDDILDETKFLDKHQLLIFYIKVAKCCFEVGFLQTCEAVIIGMTSPEVFSLVKFWINLKRRAPKDLMSLYKMTNIIFIKDRYLNHIRQQTTEKSVRFPLLDLFIQHAWDMNPDMDRFHGYHDYKIPKEHIIKKHGKLTRVKSSASQIKPKKQKSDHNQVDAKQSPIEIQTTELRFTRSSDNKQSQNVRDSNNLKKGEILVQQNHVAREFCDHIMTEALEILHESSSNNDNVKQESVQTKPKGIKHQDSLPSGKHKVTISTSGIFENQDRVSPAPKTFFTRKKERTENKDLTKSQIVQQYNSQDILEQNGQSGLPETDVGKSSNNTKDLGDVQVNHESTEVNIQTDKMKSPLDLNNTSDPEDSQYFSTLHRQDMNSKRRLSLFADESDDGLDQRKENVIEDAIENNLKTFRKNSIFEDTYLDDEVDKAAVAAIPEETPKETPKQNRWSIYMALTSRSEKQALKRAALLENLIFHDGEKSLIKALQKREMERNEKKNLRFAEPAKGKTTKKKNVTFGEVNQVIYEDWSDQNMNHSSHHPTKARCGLCKGPCCFSDDLFQDVLRSQLLAITYINSHSTRRLLRRLINNKFKKCTQENR